MNPDITEAQALSLLRDADPEDRFSITIHRQFYRYHSADAPTITWGVIATADRGRHCACQQQTTLADAVQGVVTEMQKAPKTKADELRQKAAALLAEAADLMAPE